jgi:hypothetical protein
MPRENTERLRRDKRTDRASWRLNSQEKKVPQTDDRVRRDGGKPTDESKVLVEDLVKAARNARKRNTRDEPGS